MPVSKTVQQFREGVLKKGGPQVAGKYKVLMSWPGGQLLCYPLSVVLPGRMFSFYEHDIWGTVRKIPHKRGYTQCNMTFLIYQDWNERSYMEKWMNSVVLNKNFVNPSNNDSFYSLGDNDSKATATLDAETQEKITNEIQTGNSNSAIITQKFQDYVQYYDYVGTIEIEALNSQNQSSINRKFTLRESFPAQISPLALGADATAYPTFTVGFQFNDYIYT